MNLAASTKRFLRKEMCVDLKDLERKLNESPIRNYTDEICRIIEKFHKALSHANAEDIIQKIFLEAEHLWINDDLNAVLDPLRHAFDGYAYNGLHQVFTRQENESWYPKIVLVRELEPNDIHKLGKIVRIYRGCDISEFTTRKFGQSWTTEEEVAKEFAFKHYQDQEWFQAEDRIVLEARIPRSAVLYSDQQVEFEVVVIPARLQDVRIAHNNQFNQGRSKGCAH